LPEKHWSKEMDVGDLVSEDGKAAIILARLIPGVDEAKVVKEMIHVTEEIAASKTEVYTKMSQEI
jgi:hypothetical protein